MRLIEPDKPKATLEQGFSYINKGELGKAISVMDQLISDNPYLAQAYWGRALCMEYRAINPDDINKAISDYSRSIVYSGEPSALSYGRRGILYFKAGDYEKALKDLNKALETDLFWSEARFYRGRAYLALDRDKTDIENAESDFCDVIRNFREPFAPAHFWRAQALRQLEREKDAIAEYERALEIDGNDALALNALAYCCEHGIGTKTDLKRAEKLYEKSAESGFVVARKNLAWFYANSENTEFESAERSAYWMRKAALDGDAEAQHLYGLRRFHGRGTRRDAYQAVHYFTLAEKQDYLPAVCSLAECCELGMGTQKDSEKALALYKKAADKGYVIGKYQVGRYYFYGIGVKEDNGKAFEILKPLADDGLAAAQDIIGMCYENGYGVTCDTAKAGKYYRMAYKQGHAHATVHLAARYQSGRGVKKNLTSAVKLYLEAVDRGSTYALIALGKLYFADKSDYVKAADAFRKASEGGEKAASLWLARALLQGPDAKEHIFEIYSLLTRSIEEDNDKLTASLFLSTLEFFGFCGFPINHFAAVERVIDFLMEDDVQITGVTCACVFLAQARELGFGVSQNDEMASEMYQRALRMGVKQPNACRCFVAGIAHVLYQGLGVPKDEEMAEQIIESEIKSHIENPDCDVALLYLWRKLSDGGGDAKHLSEIATKLLRDEPNNAMAAYMLYFIHRAGPDAKKHLNRLKKLLKIASPYYRRVIERQLENDFDTPVYPMLTLAAITAE